MTKQDLIKMLDGYDDDEVDIGRKFEGYQPGDLICHVRPFFDIPLRLEIAIRANGEIVFRSWEFSDKANTYLHTYEKPDRFTATEEQKETIAGLFSGRIKFEGLKLPVGATVQAICPIDVEAEEQRIGKKIYLA